MTDDRLFASNNAIGRKWYCLNMCILALIVIGTKELFEKSVIPHVSTDDYVVIAEWILNFAYFIYSITFLALMERRMFDINGTRDSKKYRNSLAFMFLNVFLILVGLYCQYNNPVLPFNKDILVALGVLSGVILVATVFVLGVIKGSISTLSYDEYRKKIKYE